MKDAVIIFIVHALIKTCGLAHHRQFCSSTEEDSDMVNELMNAYMNNKQTKKGFACMQNVVSYRMWISVVTTIMQTWKIREFKIVFFLGLENAN